MVYLMALSSYLVTQCRIVLTHVRENWKNMGENSCKEFEDDGPVFVRTGRRRARRTSETLTESTEFKNTTIIVI